MFPFVSLKMLRKLARFNDLWQRGHFTIRFLSTNYYHPIPVYCICIYLCRTHRKAYSNLQGLIGSYGVRSMMANVKSTMVLLGRQENAFGEFNARTND
jgi:hypothetical protein